MKPLGNYIHVRPLPFRASSPIVIPQAYQNIDVKLFSVLAVGSKVQEISVGNMILTHSYTAGPMDLDDGSAMVKDDQVLAVIGND